MKVENATALTANYDVSKWLKEQERAIVPSWISAVQRATAALPRGPRTRRMESTQLMQFFDAIVTAVRAGGTVELDNVIQRLVADRLGRGYRLTDFLSIADQLKNAIWRSAQVSLPPEKTVETLAALEPVFAHSVTRLAWLASRMAEAQLEEDLERTRWELSKMDRTKSDFISIAAHELKTPLTLVQGYASILSSGLSGESHLQEPLRGLKSGIGRLQAIIKDLIDVSLINTNVFTLSLQADSLHRIINLAIDDLEQDATDRHLTIEIQRFPGATGMMYLDTHRIYQAFSNLIGNAIKYTPDGGTISISAETLRGNSPDLNFVQITVADTGIGIAPDDLPHVFEKFYRVGEIELHSTGKTKFKGGGPGLGLAIVRGIVEAHEGRVWAESPGHNEQRCPGSKFHVMLSIYTEPPDQPTKRLLGLEGENHHQETR